MCCSCVFFQPSSVIRSSVDCSVDLTPKQKTFCLLLQAKLSALQLQFAPKQISFPTSAFSAPVASSPLAAPGDLSSPCQSRKGSCKGCLYSQGDRLMTSVAVTATGHCTSRCFLGDWRWRITVRSRKSRTSQVGVRP